MSPLSLRQQATGTVEVVRRRTVCSSALAESWESATRTPILIIRHQCIPEWAREFAAAEASTIQASEKARGPGRAVRTSLRADRKGFFTISPTVAADWLDRPGQICIRVPSLEICKMKREKARKKSRSHEPGLRSLRKFDGPGVDKRVHWVSSYCRLG